jgi:23S rRNA pseudouridine1911/1915/1917 synthase
VIRRAEFEAGEGSGAGSRLDLFLTDNLQGLTRSQIHKIILGGGVKVDGAVRKPGSRLKAGERVEVEFDEREEDGLTAEDIPLRILASDGSIVVLDKPSGMTVHPGAGRREGTLAAALIHAFPEIAGVGAPDRPGIVHRLDRETSGVMVAARSPAAFESLSGQFKDREVHKVYLGLVWGRMPAAEGCFTWAIGRHVRHGQKISVRTRRPKRAETRYRVLREYRETTLLEIRPVTGRTHQIRVHLAAAGHPVVGDARYGKKGAREFPRLFLHAQRLSFIHPGTGERVEFESPLPADLGEILRALP